MQRGFRNDRRDQKLSFPDFRDRDGDILRILYGSPRVHNSWLKRGFQLLASPGSA